MKNENELKRIEKTIKKSEKLEKETDEFLEMMKFENHDHETIIDYTLVDEILSSIPR